MKTEWIRVHGTAPDYGYGAGYIPTTQDRATILVNIAEGKEMEAGTKHSFVDFLKEMNGYMGRIPEADRAQAAIEFEQGDREYGGEASFTIQYHRPESDDEYAKRLKVVEQDKKNRATEAIKQRARSEAAEREMLAQLKAKYETVSR